MPAHAPEPLSALLLAGGIFYDVEETAARDVLREFVTRLPLPAQQNRNLLIGALEAREAKGSTGIGGGVAIPHIGSSTIIYADRAFVSLCLLSRPIDFGAVDGQPVHALFIVVSPSATVHLRILGQLAFALRDIAFSELLRGRAAAPAIVGRLQAIEAVRLERPSTPNR
jgi:PTS system nitrogen regulatory IIA component